MYGQYTSWLRENIPNGRPVGRREYLDRIVTIWGPSVKRTGIHGWPGRQINNDEDADFDE